MKVTWQKFPYVLKNNLFIISNTTGLSFVLKRIGPLAATIVATLSLLVLYLLVIKKCINICLLVLVVKHCWNPLVNSFCSSLGSTLLLIERTTIDPLQLWVIMAKRWLWLYLVLPHLCEWKATEKIRCPSQSEWCAGFRACWQSYAWFWTVYLTSWLPPR